MKKIALLMLLALPLIIISGENHYGICKILRMRELCIKFKK